MGGVGGTGVTSCVQSKRRGFKSQEDRTPSEWPSRRCASRLVSLRWFCTVFWRQTLKIYFILFIWMGNNLIFLKTFMRKGSIETTVTVYDAKICLTDGIWCWVFLKKAKVLHQNVELQERRGTFQKKNFRMVGSQVKNVIFQLSDSLLPGEGSYAETANQEVLEVRRRRRVLQAKEGILNRFYWKKKKLKILLNSPKVLPKPVGFAFLKVFLYSPNRSSELLWDQQLLFCCFEETWHRSHVRTQSPAAFSCQTQEPEEGGRSGWQDKIISLKRKIVKISEL